MVNWFLSNYDMGLTILKEQENLKKSHRHHWWRIFLCAVGIIFLALVLASGYFFRVAMVPGHKDFINNNRQLKRSDPLYHQKKWFVHVHKHKWHLQSANGGQYRLVADYIPAATRTNKSVIIDHGFMNNKESMGAYAYLFHHLGYNVLVPDARAQGQSQGKYIGYGYPERYDQRKWAYRLIKKNGTHSRIVLFGVSMGGATVMMTSGVHLPPQVKAVIEDCGYSSLTAEIEHEAKDLYHLPAFPRFPLVQMLSGINRVANGFFLSQCSSVKALHHNHRPTLFIHGQADTFVPTKMVYQNYRASRGPKKLWVVPKAKHAKSFQTEPRTYQRHVQSFLKQYVK